MLLIFLLGCLQAQQLDNPGLKGLVDTERAFIRMASEQNRRDAFLYFLSDNAVTKGPDGPVRGKDAIRKQPLSGDLLTWDVAFSDIASSGDFGYNTGPWEYRNKKTDTKPAAYGTYNSVWKKQPDGSWKNVLDIGIGHAQPAQKTEWRTTKNPLSLPAKKSKIEDYRTELFEQEKEFIKLLETDRLAAYQLFLSDEAQITYSGNLPFLTLEARKSFLLETTAPTRVQLIDGDVASSSDMGYVYGSAEVSKTAADGQVVKASYVRIWKKENGKNWRIVLDNLSF